MLRIGFSAVIAMLLLACATPDLGTQAGRDCFRSENVNGFSMLDRNTIEVRVGASRRYLLTTDWPTTNLNYAERIAIRSTTGEVCTGNGLGIELVGGEPVANYPIQSIVRAPERPARS